MSYLELIDKGTRDALFEKVESGSFCIDDRGDAKLMHAVLFPLELSIIDLLYNKDLESVKPVAYDAFRLYKQHNIDEYPICAAKFILQTCMVGILADRYSETLDYLNSHTLKPLPIDSQNWHDRVWSVVLDSLIKIIRCDANTDILDNIKKLRKDHVEYQERYFASFKIGHAKAVAYELIALYHITKVIELITDTDNADSVKLSKRVEGHIHKAKKSSLYGSDTNLESILEVLNSVVSKVISEYRASRK